MMTDDLRGAMVEAENHWRDAIENLIALREEHIAAINAYVANASDESLWDAYLEAGREYERQREMCDTLNTERNRAVHKWLVTQRPSLAQSQACCPSCGSYNLMWGKQNNFCGDCGYAPIPH